MHRMMTRGEKGYVTVVYRSPSQSTSEFESFLSVLEDLLNNIYTLFKIQVHYHFRWPQCHPDHQSGGPRTLLPYITQIDFLTTMHGFKQLISDPTHIATMLFVL